MSKNTSISLNDHFNDFIAGAVAEGRYGSASDVVRAGLRLLENEEAKLKALRAAIDQGDASGPTAAFDMDEFLAERHRAYRTKT